MRNAVNKNPELTFDRMCRMYVRVYRFITVLPFEGRDFDFIGTRILTCYLFCCSIVHWPMFTVYCFTSKSVRLQDICEAVLVVGVDYRFNTMMYRRKIFASLIDECRALWSLCTDQGQRTVKMFECKIRRIYQMFFFSCIFVNILYPVDALMTRLPPLEPNGTERRILPFNWFADNMENSWPGYWTIFAVQLVVVQNSAIYAAACDTAMPLLVMISSGYFRHLRDRLSALNENPNSRVSEQIRCIYFHQRLLTFCSKLAKFADMILLTQVLSAGYNISIILIKLTSSDPDKYKYLSLLCVFVGQLFLNQWAPDHLHDESEGVALAAYSAYAGTSNSGNYDKRLLTVITRAQRPVEFLAGGFIPSSLETFGRMMKSAFSFFTVLRNMDL